MHIIGYCFCSWKKTHCYFFKIWFSNCSVKTTAWPLFTEMLLMSTGIEEKECSDVAGSVVCTLVQGRQKRLRWTANFKADSASFPREWEAQRPEVPEEEPESTKEALAALEGFAIDQVCQTLLDMILTVTKRDREALGLLFHRKRLGKSHVSWTICPRWHP